MKRYSPSPGSFRRQRARLLLEQLEERAVPSAAAWAGYGHDAQHTGISAYMSQPMRGIRWQTPVDLNPQHTGGDLQIHYGSPLITSSNTVIIPVKTGATDGFEITARNGGNGNLKYTVSTDYTVSGMPFDWTPSYSPTLTPSGRLYYAGAGGTLYYIDNVDSNSAHTPVQVAFYGLSNYTGNSAAFNSSVYIDTPLTSDSQGDIFFGFRVVGTAPAPLSTTQSGYARIDPSGNGKFVLAGAASGDSAVSLDTHNLSPALSNDQSTVYVAVKSSGNEYHGYLLGLDSTTLATKDKVFLNDPRPQSGNTFKPAGILDDATSSPTVGPDGDVYFGVMGNPFNGSRGWMLHFSGDLSKAKTPGAFGWDDTVAIVPTSMVPSYQGSSSYLLFSKYNNYAGTSSSLPDAGDGVNKIAILDPNATQTESHASSNGLQVMKEVMTIAGPTPDATFRNQGFPNAVREWCINAAVVDPATKSVLANSEDGKLYRWNLATNSFQNSRTLTSGIGEAYTPTLIGADGTIYAINDAILFAVGGYGTTITVSASANPSIYGQSVTFTGTVNPPGSVLVMPTGKVAFTDAGVTIGTGTLNSMGMAQATFSTATLAAGDHKIKAFYQGDNNFAPSFTLSPLTETIKQAPTTTTVTSSVNPSVFGQPVAFSAIVQSSVPNSPMPPGTVTFEDNGVSLGTRGVTNGVARLTTVSLAVGNHSITAIYKATMNFAGSMSATLGQSVMPDATRTSITSSSNPSTLGETVTFTVGVFAAAPGAGAPSDFVTLFDGTTRLGSVQLDANQHAFFSTASLSVGIHAISATYNGDAHFKGSTSPTLRQVVNHPAALTRSMPVVETMASINFATRSQGATLPSANPKPPLATPNATALDHVFTSVDSDVYRALVRARRRATIHDEALLGDAFSS
jgi:Bacterial Ig-like domain (group 3)